MAYVGAGLPPDRFWAITPRLVLYELKAIHAKLLREKNDRIELAWMVANLSRADKLPKLKDLIVSAEPEKPQTPEEQQAFFDLLAASWGAKKDA